MPSAENKVNLMVSIETSHLDRFPDVVHQLQAAGMKVERQLDQLGIVTGSINASQTESIAHIDGVAQVEPEQGYQLSPPGSNLQ